MIEHGLARRTDPETSHEAARSINVGELEGKVLQTLVDTGGLTIKETARRLNYPEVSISPRFKPLLGKRLILDTGIRRTNFSKRKAIVWSITLSGRAVLEEL